MLRTRSQDVTRLAVPRRSTSPTISWADPKASELTAHRELGHPTITSADRAGPLVARLDDVDVDRAELLRGGQQHRLGRVADLERPLVAQRGQRTQPRIGQ